MSGWMLIIGVGMQLLFVAVIAGAVYLGYRATRKGMTHLTLQSRSFRAAYARGDLSDEEYERRRDRLETEP